MSEIFLSWFGAKSFDVLSVNIFFRPVDLILKRNKNLLAQSFKTYIKNGDGDAQIFSNYSKNCHYLHKDVSSVAAISICQPQSIVSENEDQIFS